MRLIVVCLLSMVAVAAQAEGPVLDRWAIRSAGSSCEISAYALSESHGTRRLFVHWSPDKGYVLRSWDKVVEDAGVVESVGTSDAFKISPVDNDHLLVGAPVETLASNLAQGHDLVFTSMVGGEARDYRVTTTNPRQAGATFSACVEFLKLHPVPAGAVDYRGHSGFFGGAPGCGLERFWRTAEAGFLISLTAVPQGYRVEFERVLSDHGARPSKPFTVDARNYSGAISSDMHIVSIELNEAQVMKLEAELQAGKSRSFDLSLPGFSTETLSFGSPLLRAPAASFTACRKALAAEQTASN